jgi:hypothetical protein
MVLEFEVRDSCLLGWCSTIQATLSFFFVLGIFEIGSRFHFAWAGLESQSSRSAFQVARIKGMSHWCLAQTIFLGKKVLLVIGEFANSRIVLPGTCGSPL